MRSYTVKENHIGSAVSDILQYRQTNKQTDRQTYILRQTDRLRDRQTYILRQTDRQTKRQRDIQTNREKDI